MTLTTQQGFDFQDILVSQDLEGLLDIADIVERFIDIRNKANKEEIGGQYDTNKP